MDYKKIFQPEIVVENDTYISEMKNTWIYRLLRYSLSALIIFSIFFVYTQIGTKMGPLPFTYAVPLSLAIILPVWGLLLATEHKKIRIKISDKTVDISFQKLTESRKHRFEIEHFEIIQPRSILLKDDTQIRLPLLYWFADGKNLDQESMTYTPLGNFLVSHLENRPAKTETDFSTKTKSIEYASQKEHQSIFDA